MTKMKEIKIETEIRKILFVNKNLKKFCKATPNDSLKEANGRRKSNPINSIISENINRNEKIPIRITRV